MANTLKLTFAVGCALLIGYLMLTFVVGGDIGEATQRARQLSGR